MFDVTRWLYLSTNLSPLHGYFKWTPCWLHLYSAVDHRWKAIFLILKLEWSILQRMVLGVETSWEIYNCIIDVTLLYGIVKWWGYGTYLRLCLITGFDCTCFTRSFVDLDFESAPLPGVVLKTTPLYMDLWPGPWILFSGPGNYILVWWRLSWEAGVSQVYTASRKTPLGLLLSRSALGST